jgi:hypothetical protein
MPTEQSLAAGAAASDAELYQTIARKVKEGAAVLFLGPGAVVAKHSDGSWMPLTDMCARFLAHKYKLQLSKEEECSLPYVASLLRVRNLSTDNVLQEDVARFYAEQANKCELHPGLEQLSDLRFRIIINTTPDNFITRLYDEIALPYHADFYNYYKPGAAFQFDFEKDTRVVVYNLFGSYKKPESLVLSYKHQLNYIKKIVSEQQNERLPDQLTNAFKDLRYHLFLGFDFEDWNLRLLLDTLYKNVRENIQPFSYPAKAERATHSETKVFFQGEFGMQFPQDDLDTFVQKLVEAHNNLDNNSASSASAAPKAKVLVLHNDSADKAGYELLLRHLRGLPAQFVTLNDAIGQGDVQAWLRQMLDTCQVVLPLLSVDFYDENQNPALPLMDEIARRNNPRKGFLVMPVLLKATALEGPLGQLPTLRPPDKQPLLGRPDEDALALATFDSLKKYLENLART